MDSEKAKFKPFSGFYKKSVEERVKLVQEFLQVDDASMRAVHEHEGLDMTIADQMTENVIGVMKLPFSCGMNFVINGKALLIPMVVEEPSVVAAASFAAKLSSGFTTDSDDPNMIGQIQLLDIPADKQDAARAAIVEKKPELLKLMDKQDPILLKFGGGAVDLEPRTIETEIGPMLIVNTVVNVGDSMGANCVNTMNEALAPVLEELTHGRSKLRIISNLAVRRLARAETVWTKEVLGGENVVDSILEAYYFAKNDPYRAATHNKGIMNGIDAVVHATGNDWRAVEAGAHAYACFTGKYLPLTSYSKNEKGDLVGKIELPMPVGIVGGCTKTNSTARFAIEMLGVKHAKDLGEIIAALGLAQNFAALRALATEGIQRGHMRLARRAAEKIAAEKQ